MNFLKFLILFLSLTMAFCCKNKYQCAFEEIDKREFYTTPMNGEESIEEVELLSHAIKYKPELSALYFYRAEHFRLLGEYEKAKQDYQICINQNWISGNLMLNKGICEFKLNQYENAELSFNFAETLLNEEIKLIFESEIDFTHWGITEFQDLKIVENYKEILASSNLN